MAHDTLLSDDQDAAGSSNDEGTAANPSADMPNGGLEVISIAIRPVALSFRLFGNMYGGEQTLEKLMTLTPDYLAFAPALPFVFVKLLVGFVQALVFTLLCAIFLKLICDHGDEEHH